MTLRSLQTATRDTGFGRLDFRTKLILMVVSGVLALLWQSPIALGVLVLSLGGAALGAGVRWRAVRMLVLATLPLAGMLILAHGFWNVAQVRALTDRSQLTPVLTVPAAWGLIGGLSLSLEGLVYGASVYLKSLAFMAAVPLVVFTTETSHMIVALVKAGVPYKLAFVFSSTLRFFPLLMSEIQEITEAQRLRGLDLGSMAPLQRVRIYGQMAVPLVLGALVKSQQMEIALQSRAFSGRRDRTYLHEATLTRADLLVIAALLLGLAGAVWAYVGPGVGTFSWLLFE